MRRGATTWLVYTAFGSMAFLLNGLGAALPSLESDLRLSRADVAIYPSLFAVGLIIVGLSGGRLVASIGRWRAFSVALLAIALGGVMFAAGGHAITFFGDLVVGLGAALLVQVVPAILGALEPLRATAAIGEANGVASGASVAAPLAIATSIAAGVGWRWGYLFPPIAVALVCLLALSRLNLPQLQLGEGRSAGERKPVLGLWVDLVLSVAVEFCMVFWAASAVADWHGATPASAAAVTSLFLVGMATARALASPITHRITDSTRLVLACTIVAAAGFGVFWLSTGLMSASIGLMVTGLGVALLYPATIARLIAAWPEAADRASALGALGSGVAIGAAPFILVAASDWIGLRNAYLLVPLLLAALSVHAASSWWAASKGSPTSPAR